MGTKKKRDYSSIIIWLIIGGFIGAAFGVLSSNVLKDYLYTNIKGGNKLVEILKLYGLFLIFIGGYLIHIIIHEAGHLIFGLLTGYSFISFRIASHTLIKEDGKLKYKRFNIPGTAGQCLMMPPAIQDGKFPFVIYNYGGVLLNLIVALLEILLVVYVKQIGFPLNAILVLTAAGGVFAALTNGIPMKLSGVPNDAYNVLSMLRDDEAKRGFYVQLKVNGVLTLGGNLKDMPLDMFKVKEGADLGNPLNTALRLMEYSWHLDRVDFAAAKECLESLVPNIDKIIALFKNEINCERIFLEVIGDCNKTIIDEIYDKKLKKYINAARFMIGKKRLLMAYEGFYNRDKDKALEHYEAAKRLALKYPIMGEADAELKLMEWMKERIL